MLDLQHNKSLGVFFVLRHRAKHFVIFAQRKIQKYSNPDRPVEMKTDMVQTKIIIYEKINILWFDYNGKNNFDF